MRAPAVERDDFVCLVDEVHQRHAGVDPARTHHARRDHRVAARRDVGMKTIGRVQQGEHLDGVDRAQVIVAELQSEGEMIDVTQLIRAARQPAAAQVEQVAARGGAQHGHKLGDVALGTERHALAQLCREKILEDGIGDLWCVVHGQLLAVRPGATLDGSRCSAVLT